MQKLSTWPTMPIHVPPRTFIMFLNFFFSLIFSNVEKFFFPFNWILERKMLYVGGIGAITPSRFLVLYKAFLSWLTSSLLAEYSDSCIYCMGYSGLESPLRFLSPFYEPPSEHKFFERSLRTMPVLFLPWGRCGCVVYLCDAGHIRDPSDRSTRKWRGLGFSRSHGPAESLSKASVRHHYSFLDQHLGGQILLLDFLQTTLCEYPKNKSRIYLEICFVFYYSGLCELPGDESQILQTNLKLLPFRYDNIG